MTNATFFWHDYETFGIHPGKDRPSQFAGIRTDQNLNAIGEPLNFYCKPARDALPSTEACLITGITPQEADAKGLIEAEFIQKIVAEMAIPETCSLGYNSLRFDDEVTRYTLYRNFHDPYAREWQKGCSRWDIIDLTRMTYALRPDGITWPVDENGKPSFRLEKLTKANGISHQYAHDAVSDVHAMIDFARLLRLAQPKLFNWLLELRSKYRVAELINVHEGRPLVHTTRMYPAINGCTSLVMPLVYEQRNKSSVLVYDLRISPETFIDLDVDTMAERLFSPSSELGDDTQRMPVKSLKINKCPAIAPVTTLSGQDAARIQLDLDACAHHREQILAAGDFQERVRKAYESRSFAPAKDVDLALYDGFIGDTDRKMAQRVINSTPDELAEGGYSFSDKRLPELFFRYRARNWPETLNNEETATWNEYCYQRLNDPDAGLEQFFESIAAFREEYIGDSKAENILDALEQWGDALL